MGAFEYLKHLTTKAVDEFIAYASNTQSSKVAWRPSKSARPVLEICQECLALTEFLISALRSNLASFTDAEWQKQMDLASEQKNLRDILKAIKSRTSLLLRLIKLIPEADWMKSVKTPWGRMKMVDIAYMQYMHLTYHVGQIAYIQTIYGDKKMYF